MKPAAAPPLVTMTSASTAGAVGAAILASGSAAIVAVPQKGQSPSQSQPPRWSSGSVSTSQKPGVSAPLSSASSPSVAVPEGTDLRSPVQCEQHALRPWNPPSRTSAASSSVHSLQFKTHGSQSKTLASPPEDVVGGAGRTTSSSSSSQVGGQKTMSPTSMWYTPKESSARRPSPPKEQSMQRPIPPGDSTERSSPPRQPGRDTDSAGAAIGCVAGPGSPPKSAVSPTQLRATRPASGVQQAIMARMAASRKPSSQRSSLASDHSAQSSSPSTDSTSPHSRPSPPKVLPSGKPSPTKEQSTRGPSPPRDLARRLSPPRSAAVGSGTFPDGSASPQLQRVVSPVRGPMAGLLQRKLPVGPIVSEAVTTTTAVMPVTAAAKSATKSRIMFGGTSYALSGQTGMKSAAAVTTTAAPNTDTVQQPLISVGATRPGLSTVSKPNMVRVSPVTIPSMSTATTTTTVSRAGNTAAPTAASVSGRQLFGSAYVRTTTTTTSQVPMIAEQDHHHHHQQQQQNLLSRPRAEITRTTTSVQAPLSSTSESRPMPTEQREQQQQCQKSANQMQKELEESESVLNEALEILKSSAKSLPGHVHEVKSKSSVDAPFQAPHDKYSPRSAQPPATEPGGAKFPFKTSEQVSPLRTGAPHPLSARAQLERIRREAQLGSLARKLEQQQTTTEAQQADKDSHVAMVSSVSGGGPVGTAVLEQADKATSVAKGATTTTQGPATSQSFPAKTALVAATTTRTMPGTIATMQHQPVVALMTAQQASRQDAVSMVSGPTREAKVVPNERGLEPPVQGKTHLRELQDAGDMDVDRCGVDDSRRSSVETRMASLPSSLVGLIGVIEAPHPTPPKQTNIK